MNIVIINDTAHLCLDSKGNTLELCPADELEDMPMSEFAKLVQNHMAIYYYHLITRGRDRTIQ